MTVAAKVEYLPDRRSPRLCTSIHLQQPHWKPDLRNRHRAQRSEHSGRPRRPEACGYASVRWPVHRLGSGVAPCRSAQSRIIVSQQRRQQLGWFSTDFRRGTVGLFQPGPLTLERARAPWCRGSRCVGAHAERACSYKSAPGYSTTTSLETFDAGTPASPTITRRTLMIYPGPSNSHGLPHSPA
jgi:hypothetical protein